MYQVLELISRENTDAIKKNKNNVTIKPYDINSVQNDWVDIMHK